ncbi:transcriptional regulator, TetR family [Rhizobium sp. AN5]|uniref:TetR/AcrR family transcriptional regulator n=1 Tax=Rhizobium sp. AN5 TaxID=1855304 RepID=UPI000BD6BE66|nr:TetR/AcrR family transcriptional regulator [Rhizobium sp. AN5]SOC90379.1 transcriptional regulator, TetR family [Rhizobium sp. AN5]
MQATTSITNSAPRGARRSARAHDAILSAATKLAEEGGYLSVSIEKIAASANVGKQTIYRWWPNKAALYVEVYCQLADTLHLSEDTGELFSDLSVMTRKLLAIYDDTPAATILSGLVLEAQSDPAAMRQLHEIYIQPRRGIVGAIVRRAQERGQASRSVDPDFISDLFSSFVWFKLLIQPTPPDNSSIENLVQALVTIAVAGCDGPVMPRATIEGA